MKKSRSKKHGGDTLLNLHRNNFESNSSVQGDDNTPLSNTECLCPGGCGGLQCEQGGSLRRSVPESNSPLSDECLRPNGCGGLQCEQGGSLCRSTPESEQSHQNDDASTDGDPEADLEGWAPNLHQRHYPVREMDRDIPLIDIPFNELGVLCDLAPSCKHVKASQISAVQDCFIRLISRLRHLNNVEDVTLWKKLLLLPRVLLTPTWQDIKWTRMQRCDWVRGDDWSHFTLSSFKTKPKPNRTNGNQQSTDDFLKAKLRRVRSLLSDGEISRAFKALESKQVPQPTSEQVFDQMLALHPHAENGGVLPGLPADMEELQLDSSVVFQMIRQAKKSVSPNGITSFRYELLKQLVGAGSSEEEKQFLDHFTWLLTIIANGKVPREVMSMMRSTQGAAIPKRNNKIRPLGLRDTLVNLALKVGLKMCKNAICGIFDGINYALAGSKKMDELIALMCHAMRSCQDHDRVFIDATNAFNLADRIKAFESMCSECPQLAPIFHALYDGATNVWLRADDDDWTTLLAEQGCIQGCVMGPFVFGFATLELYRTVTATLADSPNSFFGAYSDDACISAEHDLAITALRTYLEEGEQCGLHVNFASGKTEVLLGICESDEEVATRIRAYEELGVPRENVRLHPVNGGDEATYGYIHLGVPVGSYAYRYSTLQNLVEELAEAANVLRVLQNPQQEWVFTFWVLRQKFPFWLRHMCPTITTALAERIDELMRITLQPVVGHELDGTVWEQMCLPLKSHGFGVGRVEDTISAAFVSNVQETRGHVTEKLPISVFMNRLDDTAVEELDCPTVECREFAAVYAQHRQRILQAVEDTNFDFDQQKFNKALERRKLQFAYSKVLSGQRVSAFETGVRARGIPAEKARVLSANGSMSGAWLLSVPKTQYSTIHPQAFQLSCQLRLGIPFRGQPNFCICKKRSVVDPYGTHIFSCEKFRSLLKNRHDAIQNDIKALAQSGGIKADDRRLTVFRVTDEDDGKRPDLLLPGYEDDGKDLLLDITVGTPTCATYVARAANTPQYTLRLLHNRKNDKYLHRCAEIGASFMPMAFETFGAASEETMGVIGKLVKVASALTAIPYSVLFNYWKKRISTTMQVQNARILATAARIILSRNDRPDEAFDTEALLEQVHVH